MKKKRIIIIVSSALIAAVIVSISVYLGVFFHKTMTFDELRAVMASNKGDTIPYQQTGNIASKPGANYLVYSNQLPSEKSEIYVVKREPLFGKLDIGRVSIYDHFVSDEELGTNEAYINIKGRKLPVLYVYGINSMDMDIAYITLKDRTTGETQTEKIFSCGEKSQKADENAPAPFGDGILLNSPDMELESIVCVKSFGTQEDEVVYTYTAPKQ